VKILRSQPGGKSPISIALSALVVLGSVLGAWFFIDSSKTTEVFLVTKQDLPSGASLNIANLERMELSLFDLAGAYLRPESLLEGTYLQRPIGSGETIPLSAITTQDQDNWSNLVLTPQIPLSSNVSVGSKVSIWASPLLEFQTYGEPVLLAVDAEVVQLIEPEGGFAGQQKSLELRVPSETLQYLLGAISSQASMAITATGGSS
jgi:uncharacterized protein YjbI with pentapeptide repeats